MSADDRTRYDDAAEDNGKMPTAGARTIAGFVSGDVIKIAPSATLREAAVALRSADVSLAVVSDGQCVNGVISERDLVAAIALGVDVDDESVGTMDASTLSCATPESTVDAVAEEMLTALVRHILVRSEDGTLVGVVSMRDLLTAYLV